MYHARFDPTGKGGGAIIQFLGAKKLETSPGLFFLSFSFFFLHFDLVNLLVSEFMRFECAGGDCRTVPYRIRSARSFFYLINIRLCKVS